MKTKLSLTAGLSKKSKITIVVGTALTALSSFSSQAGSNTFTALQNAVTEGSTSISMRYRYENVDQDGIDKDANASTLRTRLSWKSSDFNGFIANIEVDNISLIGNDNFNSTANRKGQYPVVADPKGTDLNQAYITYRSGDSLFSAGRQRINHGDQRFVGGVGWRQNEQTYDGYRLQYDNQNKLSFDFSYIYNVNRIFGPTGDNADLHGALLLLTGSYKIDKAHKLSAYAYNLDFDTALALSSRTIGLTYDGQISTLNVHAAYASQADAGDNPVDYSADYIALEVGTTVSSIKLALGYELLGSDNAKGFATPLATLHKFQGFADKFLATPTNGVEDIYLKVSTKYNKLGLSAVWHELSSDSTNIDYGSELDLTASYPLADKIGILLKYANFSADDFATDTSKLWAMANVKF
ncbi:MAG: hypothetical protein ACI88A_001704 [Paraglaciecola sp.]|jgi:hypothetical protein